MKLDRCVRSMISEEQANAENISYLINIDCWECKFGEQSRIHKIATSLGLAANSKVVLLSTNSSTLTDKEKPTLFTEPIKKWMMATSNSDVEIIKYLVNEHPHLINTRDPLWGMTALHWAVRNNSYSMVEYLCDHGANVNIKSFTGETPLHLAVRLRRSMVYSYLTLCSNLESSILDNHGRRALSIIDPTLSSDGHVNTSKTSADTDSSVSSNLDFDLSDIYSQSSIQFDQGYSLNQSSFENKPNKSHKTNNTSKKHKLSSEPLRYTKSFDGLKTGRIMNLISKYRNKLRKKNFL